MDWGVSKDCNSLRWAACYGLFSVPRAGAPIAFALAALTSTGDAADGAKVLAAMTTAQLLGAIPIARLGRHIDKSSFFRILIAIRMAAMLACAVACAAHASIHILIGSAAVAGLVQGAAFGYLRDAANQLVEPSRMVKTLGFGVIAAEVTFLITPIFSAALGSISAALAIGAIAIIGSTPAIVLPYIDQATPPIALSGKGVIPRGVEVWLACACVNAAAVSAIEIGAVSIALGLGLRPEHGAVITGTLCVASLVGSTWMSMRNRQYPAYHVLIMLSLATAGAALVTVNHSLAASLLGSAIVGAAGVPLVAYCSFEIGNRVTAEMRPEVFSLLKTATSAATILISALIGWTSIAITLNIATALLASAVLGLLTRLLISGFRGVRGSKLLVDPAAPDMPRSHHNEN
ncbi:hypothetical protein [Neorhizobium sp. T7_12]|uniref:hypothetical protein n=1 Tax=Neorhizobium sp. T7_12 TaxID=2093832 RepID=UPI001FE1835B|nr:hypothetical protein [Neorhizobium sp. T7_12]